MEKIVASLTAIIQRWGPWGVFGAGILEQIIAPIPSPIVPMGGGFFLVTAQTIGGALREVIPKVAVPFSLGSTLGSSFVFLIAYFGGEFLVNKLEKFLEFGWKDIERFKKRFFEGKATDELLIFLLMAIPVIPSSFVSATCGAIRIRMVSFYLFTFLGLLVRGTFLGMLGWWAGEAYQEIAGGVNRIENIVFIILGLLALAALAFGYWKREKWLKGNK
ncbi:VTT domain-containing protein [bacterium]|nr:VTT domain-containing protein [bacterium]